MNFKKYNYNAKKHLDYDAKMKRKMSMDRPSMGFQKISTIIIILFLILVTLKFIWNSIHG